MSGSKFNNKSLKVILPVLLVLMAALGLCLYKLTKDNRVDVASVSEATTPPASASIESQMPADGVFHIGVVTASAKQGLDIAHGISEILRKYGSVEDGGIIRHVNYPDNFIAAFEETVAIIEHLADDPLLKVIYIIEGVPGTADAFKKIRSKRPDILLLVSESHEDSALIAEAADLVVNADFIARGYLLPYVAKKLGVKTFVHVSFPRHMIDESLNRRRAIMELASKDLGMDFVYKNAPDPTGEEGLEAAQNFILENVPKWLDEYGLDTAFFATNNAHTAPLIKQLIEHGGFFIEADVPSPIFGYSEVLNLSFDDLKVPDWQSIVKRVEAALVERGAGGRLGTWTASLSFANLMAMVEFGRLVTLGQVKKTDTDKLLELFKNSSNGVNWKGSIFMDQNQNEIPNMLLIYQDTYIFGLGYEETTSVNVPIKYRTATFGEVDTKAPFSFHIAIATGAMDQGAEDVIAAQEMIRRYGNADNGGLIHHVIYPTDYLEDPEAMAELVEGLAGDPLVKVIVVNQAIPGTAEGFRRVKEKRSDVFCLSGEPHEPPQVITDTADLVVAADFVSRGYLIPYAAKKLGAKNLVHVSFPRHLSYDTIKLRAKIMEEASKELGLNFFHETVPDPASEVGVDKAREYVRVAVPDWLKKYGTETAFFATNDAQTEPLISQLAKEGGYFVEADIPSPLLGFPGAFNLDLEPFLGQWGLILSLVEEAVVEQGGGNRMGTWAYPLGFTQTAGLVEFGKLLTEGKAKPTDVNVILECLGVFTPGARWSGSFLNDPVTGKPMRNYFLIYQDTYIFGQGYIETTKVEIPDKYFSMKPDRAEKKPRPVTMRKSRFCAIAQPFLKSFVRLWAQ
ncbi:MAG: DUF3798 domain-containing protein, partial [Deltaproteobacteria bacterium]|nr:DUF3798 domain-containing protein [Deltaproteobacteria bacterium]